MIVKDEGPTDGDRPDALVFSPLLRLSHRLP